MALHLTRALVTGASAGIGRAIAELLASQGSDLILVARTESRLQALATTLQDRHGIQAEVLAADLLDPTDVDRVAARLVAEPTVDVLVNNAGFGTYGELADNDPAREADEVRLNVLALTTLSAHASRLFRDRGQGGILQVSSMAGFQPIPEHATYAASKAYVTSFGQALHEELKPHGVHVSVCCPGYTRTEFHSSNDIETEAIPDRAWMTADDVARSAIDGLRANRSVVVPGTANKVVSTLSRVLPDQLTRRLSKAASTRINQG